MYVYIYICIYIYTYLYVILSLSLSIYIYIYICTHICVCVYIYIYTYILTSLEGTKRGSQGIATLAKHLPWDPFNLRMSSNFAAALTSVEGTKRVGKRDSIHHHLLEVIFWAETVPELRQTTSIIHTTFSGWWWWWWFIELVFRKGELKEGPKEWGSQVTSGLIAFCSRFFTHSNPRVDRCSEPLSLEPVHPLE